jgi:hypothetical protein
MGMLVRNPIQSLRHLGRRKILHACALPFLETAPSSRRTSLRLDGQRVLLPGVYILPKGGEEIKAFLLAQPQKEGACGKARQQSSEGSLSLRDDFVRAKLCSRTLDGHFEGRGFGRNDISS